MISFVWVSAEGQKLVTKNGKSYRDFWVESIILKVLDSQELQADPNQSLTFWRNSIIQEQLLTIIQKYLMGSNLDLIDSQRYCLVLVLLRNSHASRIAVAREETIIG